MSVRCNLSSACQGAFLLCTPNSICNPGPTNDMGLGGRLAASDFTIPPAGTAEVRVALTQLGEQVIGGPSGYRADVLIDLLNYGVVTIHPLPGQRSSTSVSGAALDLNSSEQGHALPNGATASCGGTLFVGPNTSCGFARAVYRAFLHGNGATTVTAASPETGQRYAMHCTGTSPQSCTGANNASVIFY